MPDLGFAGPSKFLGYGEMTFTSGWLEIPFILC
jgi:hypothetical protein